MAVEIFLADFLKCVFRILIFQRLVSSFLWNCVPVAHRLSHFALYCFAVRVWGMGWEWE